MTTDYESIRNTLLMCRYDVSASPPPDAAGVYALFLTNVAAVTNLTVESEVLYVGMTESSLEVRSHFTHSHSGFSSPRRSIGSLLKEELHLYARPRACGPSRTNITNFRFSDKGEQRLIDWMKRHLTYGFCRVERVGKNVREIESRLIKELRPPLNLTGWPNPQRAHLRARRGECREEASKSRGVA